MPIRELEYPPSNPALLQHPEEKYLIFYSSRIDGKLWCPDCVAIENKVQEIFGGESNSAVVVYVGQKAEYRDPANPFRGEPWNISSIPTIIRLQDGKEDGRLEERDLRDLDRLLPFVGTR
ncbi:hypothetical protein BJ138DRAFT_1152884 [Hygrophoropsis aurantiaca]|uniref:Uncharacterized protein n=1 Tax=Hygrophoropsis aurantiaca TaxID=72124 RepID=A0ACB8ABN5_9AGAM|nr:hypothetical protein BJ138DRAFT_1152884 [Hygrophoropsis aurantiaca]